MNFLDTFHLRNIALIRVLAVLILLGFPFTHVFSSEKMPSWEIGREFFGMHIHHLDVPYPGNRYSGWPFVPFGSWRLWWTYNNWYELEPAKGKWDFSRLDRSVSLAEKHKIDLVLTLGRTPQWASARPYEPCGQTKGCAAEPKDLKDWEDYVRAVATRYKGRISAYEIWNEPAFSEVEETLRKNGQAIQFYSGSAEKMVALAQTAYTVLKQVDPTITVVSPSVTSGGNGLRRLEEYLKRGGGRWADIIGFHFYVTPPEEMAYLTSKLRALLAKYGLSDKEIWNTEMGYQFGREDLGILSRPPKNRWEDILDHKYGAAYVARAIILAAGSGIQRIYWFNWDGEPPHPTMGLAEAAGHRYTPMTHAYQKVFDWLLGSRIEQCVAETKETWSCGITKGSKKGILVWSEKAFNSEWIPPSNFRAVGFEKIDQPDGAILSGKKVPINSTPTLVKEELNEWKK